MNYEVLVVDDKVNAAREYANLIRIGTKLEAIATDDPGKAVELLKLEPIKIVVLDQRMPIKKGSVLYKELKQIDSKLKVIMLSGEADTQELHDAMKSGYDDYLHKTRIKELPQKVHEWYVRYESDLLKQGEGESLVAIAAANRGIWPFREKIECFLVTASVLNEDYVFEDSWRTIKQISAGEKVAESDSVEIETKYKYENSSEVTNKISADIGASHLVKFQGKIESVLSEKFSTEVSMGAKRRIEIKKEFKLPEAPVDPSELHVASRHFQVAPAYRQIRVVVVRRCSCCNGSTTHLFVVYQPTVKIASRHIDYFSDGTEKVLFTGCERF